MLSLSWYSYGTWVNIPWAGEDSSFLNKIEQVLLKYYSVGFIAIVL